MSDYTYIVTIELPDGSFVEKEMDLKTQNVSTEIDEVLESSPKTRNWVSVKWGKKNELFPEDK